MPSEHVSYRFAADSALALVRVALERTASAAPPRARVLKWIAGLLAVSLPTGILLVRRLVECIYASVRALPPTARQLREEVLAGTTNPLFRAWPAMHRKLAWRRLGNYPTPVHRFACRLPEGGVNVQFWVKREDLSSDKYGGNKVRTLQYQLACCEAQVERSGGEPWKFLTFGSGGSNQVVATKTHAALIGLPAESVEALTPMPDEKEMDNTLNLLSGLSLPGRQVTFGTGMLRIAIASRTSNWVFMPGGNNPLGVLGQAGAVLELAEQISAGEAPDPDGIVVAMGSNCTVTGLILGVALAREKGFTSFQRPGFRIYGQPVHHGMAFLQRFFGVLTSQSFPLMIGRGIKETAALVAALGGPDVTDRALRVMREETVINTSGDIVGKYGAHSKASRIAKETYDASAQVEAPLGASHLWLCGHFSAKPFALLLRLIAQDVAACGGDKKMLFWQTKSAVQPLGPMNEWDAFKEMREASRALAKWAVVGGKCGTGHPVAMAPGTSKEEDVQKERQVASPEDYQAYMTPVQLPSKV